MKVISDRLIESQEPKHRSDDIERFADKPIDSAAYPIEGIERPNPALVLVALIFTDRFVDDIARRTATDSQSFDVPKLFKNIDANPWVVFPNRNPVSECRHLSECDHFL
jgi:hypothetical protein